MIRVGGGRSRRKEEKKIYNEGSDVAMSSSISHNAAQKFLRARKRRSRGEGGMEGQNTGN